MNRFKIASYSAAVKLLILIIFPMLISACKLFEPDKLVIVETGSVTDIGYNSCSIEGEIYDIGEEGLLQYGFAWAESRNPSLDNGEKNQFGIKTSTGIFNSSLTGLSAGTTYYVRAYATGNTGTVYGQEKKFNTLAEISYDTPVTDFDGNIYRTIVIGEQTWMAENLKVTHFADGSAIPHIESDLDWEAMEYIDKAYCYYDNDRSNEDVYGALYNWAAASNGVAIPGLRGAQGVCPDGWLLPSDWEWKQLEWFLGLTEEESDSHGFRGIDEGGKLKEIGTVHWNRSTGATDEFGFRALPAGQRSVDGEFTAISYSVNFWTTDANKQRDDITLIRALGSDSNGIFKDWTDKNRAISVRCVKDD